ncbi:MAG: NUDIX domain-containing protein [Patescibacteria group bacterium]|jgi:putative (di)nucleoside polyphosphate hydrolase
MEVPDLIKIDQIRNRGFRPQVVGCFINDKKVLFLFKKEHNLWQLPQGGVNNKELLKTAFFREMAEELGSDFIKTVKKNIQIFGEDEVKFPSRNQNTRELRNDADQDIYMKGKKYFFITTSSASQNIDITKTEFDDFKWLSFEDGLSLCDTILQKGKKRITTKALKELRNLNLI